MASEPAATKRTAVWLDCDPGRDDLVAILLALHLPGIELLGLSSVRPARAFALLLACTDVERILQVHGNATLEHMSASSSSSSRARSSLDDADRGRRLPCSQPTTPCESCARSARPSKWRPSRCTRAQSDRSSFGQRRARPCTASTGSAALKGCSTCRASMFLSVSATYRSGRRLAERAQRSDRRRQAGRGAQGQRRPRARSRLSLSRRRRQAHLDRDGLVDQRRAVRPSVPRPPRRQGRPHRLDGWRRGPREQEPGRRVERLLRPSRSIHRLRRTGARHPLRA